MGNDCLSAQIARPPIFDLTSTQPSFTQAARPLAAGKGKGKARVDEKPTVALAEDTGAWCCYERLPVPEDLDYSDDRLWVDIYEPLTEVSLLLVRRAVTCAASISPSPFYHVSSRLYIAL